MSLDAASAERWREHACRMVVAEIEDCLTAVNQEVSSQYTDELKALGARPKAEVAGVAIEAVAIAGEAVIRLATARGEDPRATWQWLMSTEWTDARDTAT
jgi:hypothetical protein